MSKIFLIIFFSLASADREAIPVGPMPSMDLCREYAQRINHSREILFAQCVWLPGEEAQH
jgi:hypothetical protein